jgi:hypothetical protein
MTVETATPLLDERFGQAATEDQLSRAAKALAERSYTVHVVDSVDEARRVALDLLPRDKAIFTAASETLRATGIAPAIEESGEFQSVRRQLATLGDDVDAQMRLGAAPDVVVGSVHALTEDGVMVVTSATGSQLSSYAAGARKALWVVGAQKVVPDLESAFHRIRTYCLPKVDHLVRELKGVSTFIGKTLILEREYTPDRGTVILIREAVGF